jgi:ABC-type lipoprotein export system ATPase subunit
MHKLTIHNFGPIRDATIDINRFLLFIGPQSSGKSTIAKLIYFFLHVRDEVTAFIMDVAQDKEQKKYLFTLKKRLRNRFVEFFGATKQLTDVSVTYDYGNDYFIRVSLDREYHVYTSLHLSETAWQHIKTIIMEIKGLLRPSRPQPAFLSTVGKLASDQQRTAILQRVRQECNLIFSYDKELFFIPAGRSLLSTLSDQMQYIHPHQLDYPMRQFVETVNASKSFFDKSLDDIIRDQQALSRTEVWFSAVKKAKSFIKKILQGEYRYDREGGKLYISDDVYAKINYASSGQQESVWILLSLFLLVLERAHSLVVIEEPEAHLYPTAQKELIEYISFVFNIMKCDFVLTTHSPYLLSCINNMMYAYDLSKKINSQDIHPIVPQNVWLRPSEVSGYFVHDGIVDPLKTEEPPVLKCEWLDTASDLINEDYDALLKLESKVVSK